jgi:hypothetical protein
MNDKNLEQQINIKFCMKISRSASEYSMKKSSVLNGIGGSRTPLCSSGQSSWL